MLRYLALLFVQCIVLLCLASADSGSSLRARIEADLTFNYSQRPVIYLFSHSTGELVIPFIIKLRKIKSSDILCVDATEASLSESLMHFASSRTEQAIMVVRGTESLRGDQIENLNFLHGVSDSNSVYPALVVVMLWDVSAHPIPDDVLFRDHFRQYLISGGDNINPTAILGRFSLTAVDARHSFANTDFNQFWASLCSGEHTQHFNQEQSLNTAAIMCGIVLVLIVAMSCTHLKPVSEPSGSIMRPIDRNPQTPKKMTKSIDEHTPTKPQTPEVVAKEEPVTIDPVTEEEEEEEHVPVTPAAPKRGRRSTMKTPARTVHRDSDGDTSASKSVRRSTRKSKPVQYYE